MTSKTINLQASITSSFQQKDMYDIIKDRTDLKIELEQAKQRAETAESKITGFRWAIGISVSLNAICLSTIVYLIITIIIRTNS